MAKITQAERNKARNFGYLKPKPPRYGGPRKPGLSDNDWARREAQRYIDAQIKAIQQSQQIYLDELNRQAQERIKQGQALASWLQGQNFPSRIQGIYQTAGNDVAGYAKGFAGDIRDIASADAAAQQNMLSGTGQEGAVRNEGTGMGDVIYGAYGWSPARAFAETGAAYASDAALQPSFAARFAADEAMKMQQEGLGGLKDFALQMAEARSGKYQVVQDLMERRQAARDNKREWYLKMAAIAAQQGDDARANAYLKLAMQREDRISYASQGYAPDGKTLLPGWVMSPKGPVPPGYRYNPKTGTIDKKYKPGAGDKPKAVDWGKMQEDMVKTAKSFYRTRPIPGDIMGNTEKVKWTRGEAYRALFAQFSGKVKDVRRLRALINRVLDLLGFEKSTKKPNQDPNGPENPGR